MPRFDPPVQPQAVEGLFWGRFDINVGVSVVKVGGHFVNHPAPTQDDLNAAGVEGVDYFRGGYIYSIPPDIGNALIADGYTVDMSAGFGYGTYGRSTYGA